jgi:hypothetical protein
MNGVQTMRESIDISLQKKKKKKKSQKKKKKKKKKKSQELKRTHLRQCKGEFDVLRRRHNHIVVVVSLSGQPRQLAHTRRREHIGRRRRFRTRATLDTCSNSRGESRADEPLKRVAHCHWCATTQHL